MIDFKTKALVFLGAEQKSFKDRTSKEPREVTYFRAKLADGSTVYEMSLTADVYESLRDLKTATGEATVGVSQRVKGGKTVIQLNLLSFEA